MFAKDIVSIAMRSGYLIKLQPLSLSYDTIREELKIWLIIPYHKKQMKSKVVQVVWSAYNNTSQQMWRV
jgi:hypothetical protein